MRLGYRSIVQLTVLTIAVGVGAAAASKGFAQSDKAQSGGIREIFRLLDSNGDGRISRDEFERNKVAVIFRNAKDEGTKLRFEDTHLTRSAFDTMDIGGKGVITARDVMFSPIFKFETFDTDANGYIDYQEFENAVHGMQR